MLVDLHEDPDEQLFSSFFDQFISPNESLKVKMCFRWTKEGEETIIVITILVFLGSYDDFFSKENITWALRKMPTMLKALFHTYRKRPTWILGAHCSILMAMPNTMKSKTSISYWR